MFSIVLSILENACSGEFQESLLKDISGLYKTVNYGKFFSHIGSKASLIM